MDSSRNGGNALAPPRPPKLLPRIHRPKAVDPTVINITNGNTLTVTTTQAAATATATVTVASTTELVSASAQGPAATATLSPESLAGSAPGYVTAPTTPQCTNSHFQQSNNLSQQQQQHQQQQQQQLLLLQQQNPPPISINDKSTAKTTATAAANATATAAASVNKFNNNNNNNNNTNISNNKNQNIESFPFDDYQIYHLTFLPQRPNNNNNNNNNSNNSHLNITATTTTATATAPSVTATVNQTLAANSFIRRKPPSPLISGLGLITGSGSGSAAGTGSGSGSGLTEPLLTISGYNNSSNSSNSNNFYNINTETISTVTLAQPRPESERLSNEYVDTPLRMTQQLQNATRTQHPAGQQDNGQTTTHHLLLLPQRELRHQHHQQQQQQQQQTQHSYRLVGTVGTVGSAKTPTATVDRTTDGGFIHSQQQHNNSKSLAWCSQGLTADIQTITQTQPITKQPASSMANNGPSKYTKDIAAFDDLFTMHSITNSNTTTNININTINNLNIPPNIVAGVNRSGSSRSGIQPIMLTANGASEGQSLSPITCPSCQRCRCEQCQSPRPLPQTWVCNKTCLCSAESIIDYASCLCCAKALFYHCARDNDMDCDDGSGTPCVDNPCSCGNYKRTQRWGWLGALSLVLPCLWCYWPMRGCVAIFEKCYDRFARQGCRCQPNNSNAHGNSNANNGLTQITTPLTINGSTVMVLRRTVNDPNNINGSLKNITHHNQCTNVVSSNRILRKGNLTPEKRLLDTTSSEY